MMPRNGFSFIELLFVLIIMVILIGIAIPSYQQYVIKTKRIEGKIALLDLATKLERHFATNHTYADATISSQKNTDSLNKQESLHGFYQLKIISQTDSSYLIQASPITNKLIDDFCGSLQLNQLGERSVTGKGDLASCW